MKMKMLQITAPGEFNIIEADVPKVKDHQVLVEIEIVATCPRWDINMLGGRDMFDYSKSPEYPLPPGWPGHEVAGVVREVGSGVQGFKPGDRIAALEHIMGDGAYAQFICYQEHEIIKLPDTISSKQAVSFELLKCVMIGLSQFGDIRGKSMVVSGMGPAGMLGMQVAKIWGASEVVGVDVNEERIKYVNELGIGVAMHTDQVESRRFTLGYDCVGAAPSVQNLLRIVDRHIVIFGVLKGTLQYDEHLWFQGMKLESYKYRRFNERDRELLIDAVANQGLNTECIQTHHVPFTNYQEAVDLLKSQTAIKVHFYPGKDFS
ncbi:zinc-dependent alcohol dehydrogenase [Paenibacillus eucommiae]|uniref:Threonine dehydrogenase-like Zn-dependent dehydrogenase n=1 Tax=Paenibacillus eucommiae TaxID=1355755 RepID=A0ABS4J817_9BACL|nr:zinc-binding dehydrogenase [Paenibacillus eucommiae]MBP1995968.1 threonine dehydrogenase-like Zn-dependent dehydrogenase [Paenibacillus eucommiae]